MDEEKQNFIEAIKEDVYAEYELAEDLTLITDWESDGIFYPYIVGDNRWEEHEIETLLSRKMGDVFSFYELEYDEPNDAWYPIVEGCKYENAER